MTTPIRPPPGDPDWLLDQAAVRFRRSFSETLRQANLNLRAAAAKSTDPDVRAACAVVTQLELTLDALTPKKENDGP